jgi:hypothetical protein
VAQQQEWLVEQQEAFVAVATAAPEYLSGAASNFVSQPREQKEYVSPLWRDEPAAVAGSMVIPQTGSMTVSFAFVRWFMCCSFQQS